MHWACLLGYVLGFVEIGPGIILLYPAHCLRTHRDKRPIYDLFKNLLLDSKPPQTLSFFSLSALYNAFSLHLQIFTISSFANPSFFTIPPPASGADLWKLSSEVDQDIDSVFSVESGSLEGIDNQNGGERKIGDDKIADPFSGVDGKGWGFGDSDVLRGEESAGGNEEWATAEDYQPWSFSVEGKEEGEEDVFGIEAESGEIGISGLGDGVGEGIRGIEKSEQGKQLESEEKALTAVLKGPDRAFGDLIAASGITDEMLDSLIALKDFEGIQGLPPLSEIEDMRYEKNTRKSSRAEIERQKQEEAAKARVRQVDEKGRAYGTGKRKCSIARVWIQPGWKIF
ncbi:UNVERIFIED_CONTAM: 30S ribosomal protein S9, mitochondrial [Sesamum radiatum]|uniref:30S ribosomal protein S9, mitochondrial n=1 Tax=Sesamum radiatum TaxID=300843 RepID=A0AAW2JYS3_SESRA